MSNNKLTVIKTGTLMKFKSNLIRPGTLNPRRQNCIVKMAELKFQSYPNHKKGAQKLK